MKIAILASGNGSNFEAIVKATERGKIRNAKVVLLITDKKNAFVRVRAKRHKIKDVFVDPNRFKDRVSFDRKIARILRQKKIDLVVLAGFMRILTPYFVRVFKNRILNIHPALLPSFKGTAAIERAYHYGVKVTGVTVHFVDEDVDHGPIILQAPIYISERDDLESLEKKIHRLEHRLYPLAIKLFIEGKLVISKRKVLVQE